MSFISDNEISNWGLNEPVDAETTDEQTKKVQPIQDQRKISLPEGIPQLFITSDKITMTYQDSGIAVNENGTIIKGKMHLGADIRDIRINGFWTFNTELLTCLPSTAYTPMPVLKYSTPPFAETISNLATIVA